MPETAETNKKVEQSKDTNCGSDLQEDGFLQVLLHNGREMKFERLGVSTNNVKNIDCTKGATHNMTGDVCQLQKPGHVMVLQAKSDRRSFDRTTCGGK